MNLDTNYYNSILDNLPQLICRFKIDTTLTYVNKSYCEYFQKTKEELIGQRFKVFITQKEQKRFNDYINFVKHEHYEKKKFELKILTNNRETKWQEWSIIPVLNKDNEFLEYQAIGDDITQRKQKEIILQDELKKTNRELHISYQESYKILENNPLGIYVTNQKGNIVYANKSFCYLIDCNLNELIGNPFYKFFSDADSNFYANLYMKFYNSNEKELRIEKEIFSKIGEPIELLLHGIKYYYSNGNAKIVTYVVDLTDIKNAREKIEKALEHEKHLNEMKSRFIMFVSHEFRTPITIIKSSVQIIEKYSEKLDQQKQQSLLEDINHASNYLVSLLEDAVFIDKVESGKLDIRKTPIEPKSYFSEILNEIKKFKKNIHYDIKTRYEILHKSINTDPNLLKYIFINLVSNSIKYSEGKQTIIKMKTISTSLYITIADRGIGIPDKDKQFLFTPFHRAKNVGNVEGVGLGLVIVRQAVKLLKGKIRLRSKQNSGTVVRLSIPIE